MAQQTLTHININGNINLRTETAEKIIPGELIMAWSFIWPNRIVTQSGFFFLFGPFPKRLDVEHELWINSLHGTFQIGHRTMQLKLREISTTAPEFKDNCFLKPH